MKHWFIACTIITAAACSASELDPTVRFTPSGSSYLMTDFQCPPASFQNFVIKTSGTPPSHDNTGYAIGNFRTYCRSGTIHNQVAGYASSYPNAMAHVWYQMSWGYNATITYSGVAAPPPKPKQPSRWQAVTYAPATVVGAYTSVSVPLTSVQTGVFKYDVYASQPWCAEIAVRSTVTGDKPISVGIRGLAPCNYAYVITIVATLL